MSNYRVISDIVKVYPHMLKIVIYHENQTQTIKTPKPKLTKEQKIQANIDRSVRRSKERISDIIASNQFDLWCTFTFNCKGCPTPCKNWIPGNHCICPPEQCRRLDPDICKMKITSWLKRMKVKSPDLTYLIVPEFHEKGGLHFHGFIKASNAQLLKTGKKQNNKDILRFKSYTMGFNYVIDISQESDTSHSKIAQYMQKYITKSMPQFHGKKRYFCSQGLDRPKVKVNGVSSYGLQNIIRGSKPAYINDVYEVQYHAISGYTLESKKQPEFNLIGVQRLELLKRKKRLPLTVPSH